MNTDDGMIKPMSEWQKLFKGQLPKNIKPMEVAPTEEQLARGRVGRNEPCPCGSGKKFKKCCYTGGARGGKQ